MVEPEDSPSNTSPPTVECAVCGDLLDPLEETHYSLKEETRPIPDSEDMDFSEFFSKQWVICWPCVWTKLGISGTDEHETTVSRHASREEIRNWNEAHDEPHPVFSVDYTPERHSFSKEDADTETE